jgi:membrane protease YdiL (CAAX protease family)
MPAIVPLAMQGVFRQTIRLFGPRRGYQAGFAVYWAACWGAALACAGPSRIARLWERPAPTPTGLRPLTWAVLLTPPVGAISTEWLPHARAAGPRVVGVAAALGVTNALAEEALWRGAPAVAFPDEPVRGWLWPAVGFTLWHLVPLGAVSADRRRSAVLLAGAALIGVGNGRVAWRTHSLSAVTMSHAVTDASGLESVRRMWA